MSYHSDSKNIRKNCEVKDLHGYQEIRLCIKRCLRAEGWEPGQEFEQCFHKALFLQFAEEIVQGRGRCDLGELTDTLPRSRIVEALVDAEDEGAVKKRSQ